MRRVLVLGFVSPLHRDRVPKVNVDGVISGTDDIRRVEVGDSLVVAVVMSGGVSRLVGEFVEFHGLRRLLLVSHPDFNSLASALDAKAVLSDLGVDFGLLHLNSLDELGNALRVARAIARILGVRVALLGVETKSNVVRAFEDRLEATVDLIGMRDFERLVETADEEVARNFVEYMSGRVGFSVDKGRLLDVGRIYSAMRGLYGRYDATAINCFPYLMKHGVTPCLALARLNEEGLIAACEADLRALFSMVVSRELTGYSGWIANTNHVQGGRVTMAHCTIALNMVRDARVLTHFESGFPYGLTGKLVFDEVTGVSVSGDFRRMGVFTAKVIDSGLISGSMCRTQAVLDIGTDASAVLRLAPYNHHVIIPGNVVKELEVIASVLGMSFTKYSP